MSIDNNLDWISAFDDEERHEMAGELMELYRKATRDGNWDALEARMHEWSESGWATLSSDLAEAFNSPEDRILLQPKGNPRRGRANQRNT